MTLGPLMLDLAGQEVTREEKDLIAQEEVGGVILFARNYKSKSQLDALVNSIREVKSSILIAVDHEGGRVQRFREGFTVIPAMGEIGALYDKDQGRALDLARSCGWVIGAELRSSNIDLCFAPVLDVDFGVSEVIGDRSFHRDPSVIAVLAAAFIKGLNEAGMAAVGKHFPGHGGVAADSHLEIPVDSRGEETIRRSDLVPFEVLAGQLAGVMPAHVIYDQVDPNPAGFSSYWLLQVLRDELKFEGAIFSDDLSMQGASAVGSFEERAKQALAAGCDMVLVCNDRPGALVVLEYLRNNPFKGVQERLQRLQGGIQFEKELMEKQALEKSALWQGHIKNITALILK